MDETALHRTGTSSPLGKCTAEIPKLKVPEVVWEKLSARAASVGMSLSEYAKAVLTVNALGREEVESLERARLDVVAGKGSINGE